MALWKWFLQTIAKLLQQQDGVGKYVYLDPWAFLSFGPSGREFCHDAHFCCSRRVFCWLACMALWKWFLQTITKMPQQQDGVCKYVYLDPWAFWSFGPSGREFCHDAHFCCSRSILLACLHGVVEMVFANNYENATAAAWCR